MTDNELRQLFKSKGGGIHRNQFLPFDSDMTYATAKALYAEGRVVIMADRRRQPAGWGLHRSVRGY